MSSNLTVSASHKANMRLSGRFFVLPTIQNTNGSMMVAKGSGAHLHDDPTRTTPMGMVRYGHEFLEAAFAIYERAAPVGAHIVMPPVPALYLLGHGLELTFKAFLLAKGVSLNHLRKKVGHDLEMAFNECKEQGIEAVLNWNPVEETVLSLLNTMYSAKELEYIVTGAKQVPHFPLLQNFAVRLFGSVASPIGFRDDLNAWEIPNPSQTSEFGGWT